MVRDWEEKGPDFYAPLQFEILDAAVRMLRPGGMMVYSTCTFSEIENEGNVMRLLEKYPNLQVSAVPDYPGFLRSRLPGLCECVRVMPHRMRGEGQFVCLMQKSGSTDKSQRQSDVSGRLYPVDDRLYLLPRGHMPRAGLRYLMTGLLVGTWKAGYITPSQALAQAIRPADWPRTLDLRSGDERLMRYLRGESISYKESEIRSAAEYKTELFGIPMAEKKAKRTQAEDRGRKSRKNAGKNREKSSVGNRQSELYCGDILILADGYPVGFGAGSRGLLKNRRNPGWRIS